MDKTPLQQMIDLWEGIASLHYEGMVGQDTLGKALSNQLLRNAALQIASDIREYNHRLEASNV